MNRQRTDATTNVNVNTFLCEIANKNLVSVDNLLEQNRVIQNYLINENTYQQDSFITMFSNILDHNFQLAETILNQNNNIQTYFISQSTNELNNGTNINRINSLNNSINYLNSLHSRSNLYPRNSLLQPTNNSQQQTNNLQQQTNHLQQSTNHLQQQTNNLQQSINHLQPETSTLSFQILYNNLPDIQYYDISVNDSFFDSVRPVPTEAQINNAIIQPLRYSDILSPVNDICPITREPFTDNSSVSVIRYCKHVFNRTELTNWFQYNCVCPVCRYDIREYSTEEESHEQNRSQSHNNSHNQTSSTDSTLTQTMIDLLTALARQR